MIRNKTDIISKRVNPDRLYLVVYDVAQFHRIQASTGFRAAAEYCKKRLESNGIKSEILSYPAKEGVMFLTSPSFKEWDCRSASLTLVSPEEICLADFSADAISVIQRSVPCDYREKGLEVFLMDKGSAKENYENDDLSGKLLFIDRDFNEYGWTLEKGALGFISEHVAEMGSRTRGDMYDIRKYTSFWAKKPTDISAFGFVITPRMGDRLRKICLAEREHGRLPVAKCHVDSSLYDGHLENVTAVLEGISGKEILITAHLCHPRASANDNASGVSAAIESLVALKSLIDDGKLPPLKHTIRILLVPEFAGTYAYFDAIGDKKSDILAGINLDMVGGRQSKGYGPLTVTSLPHSTPSFTISALVSVLECLRKEADALDGNKVPMFNSTVSSFVGGSDHVVLSDPTIGVPSAMVGQFPDLNYHTNGDTIEVIDRNVLHKSCSLAASFAYIMATLSEDELPEILSSTAKCMTADLAGVIDDSACGSLKVSSSKAFEIISRFYADGLDHLSDFGIDEKLYREAKESIIDMAQGMFDMCPVCDADISAEQKDIYIPKRLFTGPIDRLEAFAKTEEQLKNIENFNKTLAPIAKGNHTYQILIAFYMDGMRTNAEIARLIAADCKISSFELVNGFIELLISLGLAEK